MPATTGLSGGLRRWGSLVFDCSSRRVSAHGCGRSRRVRGGLAAEMHTAVAHVNVRAEKTMRDENINIDGSKIVVPTALGARSLKC